MEKLQKYCLKLIVVLFLITACNTSDLKKDKRLEAEKVYSEAIKNIQGSPAFMNGIANAVKIDPTFDKAVRELSVAYVKRGMPLQWKPIFDQAVELNPEKWLGYRGYLYLWFYRDYKKAIQDFDAVDALTPNFIDNPQGHSVHYWRGIAYLGLKDYENSISYFQKHLKSQKEKLGEDWVEINAYLYLGIAYYETNELEKANLCFDNAIKYNDNKFADAKYYKSKIYKQKGDIEKAKIFIKEALEEFNLGYLNKRVYVEALRELYLDDYKELELSL